MFNSNGIAIIIKPKNPPTAHNFIVDHKVIPIIIIVIIGIFFARFIDIKFGHIPGAIVSVIVIAFMSGLYIKGKPFFKKYTELLKNVKDGYLDAYPNITVGKAFDDFFENAI